MTNKQHAVPQNIMDVEFKIIGDLTMRQFLYLFITGMTSYGLYTWMESPAKWMLILVLSLTGIALAFVPLQERGLDQWIVNFFSAIYSPTQMVWKKVPVVPVPFTYQSLNMVKKELITLAPTSSRRKLEEYLEVYDDTTVLDPLDIDETYFISKVRDAFQYDGLDKTTKVGLLDTEPQEEYPTPTLVIKPTDQQADKIKEEHEQPIQAHITQEKPEQTKPDEQETKLNQNNVADEITSTKPIEQEPAVATLPEPQKQDIKSKLKIKLPKHTPVRVSQMTPDRVSGRVFTNLVPSSGEIVLPIRGEKVLKTEAETQIEEDISEKAKQLENLLNQIKSDEKYKEIIQKTQVDTPQAEATTQPTIINYQTRENKPSQEQINKEAEVLAQTIKQENTAISDKISSLQSDLDKQSDEQKQQTLREIKRLQEEKERALKDYESVKAKVKELEDRLKSKSSGEQTNKNNDVSIKIPKIIKPSFGRTIPMASASNIVSGIVLDEQDKPIENILVLIKNAKNEPVRAIKTNVMGQFYITTPMSNGKYKIQVDKGEKKSLSFDIIEIEAKGEPIPPVEIKGKNK